MTPSQTIGPFFHFPHFVHPALGRMAGEDVKGERLQLTVRLLDGDSTPVPDGLIERIAERFSPDKIILFGSCARGDASPESDIDLLVLFREVADPHKRAAELYMSLVDFPRATDIIVSTTSRFERYGDVVNTVYWPASREGKVLYERSA